jgi:hypothetical protein
MEDCWERLNRQKDVWTKRNTFFKALSYRPEIKSLEFSTGKYLQEDEAEYHIDAPQFSSYILEYDSEVTCDENAKVYIVSPVLIKNAKGRWHGLYNNCSIKINMTDSEFESQVQNGEIEFKSGFFIECKMEYEQYYNENQELVRNNYRVCEVYRYGVDGNMRTTPKKHFKRNDECQLELPFN